VTTWQKALAVVGLVVAALAGGYAICHSAAAAAARRSADSLAVMQRSHDSTVAVLRFQLAQRDSAARADSVRVADLDRRAAIASAGKDGAAARARKAFALLDSARSALDSFAIYRDSLVPALGTEIGALGRQLVTVDSARQSYRDAYVQEIAANVKLGAIISSDSTLILSQRAQLLADAKAAAKVPAPWSKLESAAETGAIGAATTGACVNKVFSVGCIAGAAEVVKRILHP
jgi:hypothetical protein